MVRNSQRISISTLGGLILLALGSLFATASRSQQTPQQPSSGTPQAVPLAHLYWHFLTYQNHLDTVAAAQEAQGQDGTVLRNIMQTRLGFSDADFAIIRASSVRLTGKMQALHSQVVATQSKDAPSLPHAQFSALIAQRDANIAAEISFLKQRLSRSQITTLEEFLYQLFSLNNPAAQAKSLVGQSSTAAVQQ